MARFIYSICSQQILYADLNICFYLVMGREIESLSSP